MIYDNDKKKDKRERERKIKNEKFVALGVTGECD